MTGKEYFNVALRQCQEGPPLSLAVGHAHVAVILEHQLHDGRFQVCTRIPVPRHHEDEPQLNEHPSLTVPQKRSVLTTLLEALSAWGECVPTRGSSHRALGCGTRTKHE